MNRRQFATMLTLVATFIFFISAPPAAALVPQSQRAVLPAIQRVRNAKGINAKVDAAEQLRGTVLATDPRAVDDRTIHEVASLLDYNNEAIRYWIAEALGHFGVRSKFAVPKLRAILDERECMIAETSSVSMIRDTLERIGEPAPERKCEYYILPKRK